MATTLPAVSVLPAIWTAADMLDQLGGIPPERVRMVPPPGTASEQDVLRINDHEDRICELIDAILVEKPMGYFESCLAMALGYFLSDYLTKHDLGILMGEAGLIRLLPGQVRVPDLAFVSWDRFPNRQLPPEPILPVAPDLAVEILSKSNTAAEMQRKLREYFKAGTQLVWIIDPPTRTAMVYSAPNGGKPIGEDQSLEGGDVLPGFKLALRDLFARAGNRASD